MGPVIDFYGVRGTMWARFMSEIVLSISGPTHTRLRASVGRAFTPKGELLVFLPPLTGRDPLMFADPLKFDPERENAGRHQAFGRGAHICMGMFLAKAQLQEDLHLIAQRLRNPRLNGEIAWRQFLGSWGLSNLPITFDPA